MTISRLLRPLSLLAGFFSSLISLSGANQPHEWRDIRVGGGGYVTGIIASPQAPYTKFIRTDVGGAYRWDGTRWRSLTDRLGALDERVSLVESIAVDPTDPATFFMSGGRDSTSPQGVVYRTKDGGETWQATSLNNNITVNGNGHFRQSGERIAIDPNKPSVVYVGTRAEGLFKSTDGGLTFAQVASAPTGGTFLNHDSTFSPVGIPMVLIDPTRGIMPDGSSRHLYISAAGAGVYRSSDAGATWSTLSALPGGSAYYAHRGDVSADGNVIIGFSNEGEYPTAGSLWKISGSGGNTFTDVTPVIGGVKQSAMGYGSISFSRRSPNIVFVSRWHGGTNVSFFRSLDAGVTWANVTPTLAQTPDVPYSKARGFIFGPSAILLDPADPASETVWMTNGNSPWRTTTQGQIATTWAPKDAGHDELIYCNLLKLPGQPLISNVMDMVGYRHTDLDSSPTYRLPTANLWDSNAGDEGQGMSLDHCASDPRYIFRSGFIPFGAGEPWLTYSDDYGATWKRIPDQSVIKHRHTRLAVASNNPARLVCVSASNATDNRPYYSTNGGSSWTVGTGFDPAFYALEGDWTTEIVLIADRTAPDTFYVRDTSSYPIRRLYRSTDGGATWQLRTSDCPPKSLHSVPGQPGVLIGVGLAASGRSTLWRSLDAGATWTQLKDGDNWKACGLGKAAPGQTVPALYGVAQINGVWVLWRSPDALALPGDAASATWEKISADDWSLPFYYTMSSSLTGDPEIYGQVYIGTGGRGAYYVRPSAPLPAPINLAAAPAATQVRLTWTDLATDETGYQLQQRGLSAPGPIFSPNDTVVGSSSNYPGEESPSKAIDGNPGTKYLNFDKLNTGLTVMLPATATATAITLTSANDSPARDPATVTISGSQDGVVFTPIVQNLALGAFTERGQSRTFTFTNTVAYSQYRIVFSTVADAAGANSMQIADVQLTGTRYTWSDLVTVPANTTRYVVSGLTPSADQAFRIRALRATENHFIYSEYTAPLTVQTYSSLSGFKQWLFDYDLDTALPGTADTDGDGISNLLEYSLGTAPESSTSRPPAESQISESRLQISFLRARADVTYVVEGSGDLATWSTVATNPGVVGQSVIVADTVTLTESVRRFLRLRVSSP